MMPDEDYSNEKVLSSQQDENYKVSEMLKSDDYSDSLNDDLISDFEEQEDEIEETSEVESLAEN